MRYINSIFVVYLQSYCFRLDKVNIAIFSWCAKFVYRPTMLLDNDAYRAIFMQNIGMPEIPMCREGT